MLSASYYQNWNFTTNNGFSTLRSDLLNSALFGNSGVVNRAVNFLPSTTTVTSSQLSGTDVVLYIAGGQTNSAELSVLKPFVESGGGLFVFGNNILAFAGIVGSLDTSLNWVLGSTATVSNSNSPLNQGPFGNLAVGTQFYVPTHCVLNSTGPNAVVGVNESAGNFAMSYQIGQGRVVLIGDEEIFLNADPGFSADPRLTNTTRLLFQNAFAYVATVPEPSTYALGLIAAGAMAWVARRKRPQHPA